VILALVAGLGIGRARRSGQQLACLLWLATGLGLLLASDIYQFSWRYQLPALVTIPPAAALALSALTSPRAAQEPAAREPQAAQELSGPGGPAPAPPATEPAPPATEPVRPATDQPADAGRRWMPWKA
jgi:hypothetical protein